MLMLCLWSPLRNAPQREDDLGVSVFAIANDTTVEELLHKEGTTLSHSTEERVVESRQDVGAVEDITITLGDSFGSEQVKDPGTKVIFD